MIKKSFKNQKVLFVGLFNQNLIHDFREAKEFHLCALNNQFLPSQNLSMNNLIKIDQEQLSLLEINYFDVVILNYSILGQSHKERNSLLSLVNKVSKESGEIELIEPLDFSQNKELREDFKELLLRNYLPNRASAQILLPSEHTILNLIELNGLQIIKKENLITNLTTLPYSLFEENQELNYPHLHLSLTNDQNSVYQIDQASTKLKPREKLLNGLIEEMQLSELLAILIGMGNKQEDVFSMCERIIREYGFKGLASETDPKKLMEILAIGEVNACKLVSAFEIGRRFYSEKVKGRQLIRGPEDVFNYAKDMSELVKENFRGLYLNTKNYIIHDEIISIGHLSASLVHPREVFKPAIEYSAAGLIVLHNHPSGDPAPSDNDKEITKMLFKAGQTLGISLLDHIIIGADKYYSFNDSGAMN